MIEAFAYTMFFAVVGGLLMWAKQVQKRKAAALNPTSGDSVSSVPRETESPTSSGQNPGARSGLTDREVQVDAARERVKAGYCFTGCGGRATAFLPCPTLIEVQGAWVYKALGAPVPRRYVVSDSFGPAVARSVCKLHAEIGFAACEKYIHDMKGEEAALVENQRVRMAEWQGYQMMELLTEQAQTARKGGPTAKKNRKIPKDNVVQFENKRKAQQGE